jgi:hypothetical protein
MVSKYTFKSVIDAQVHEVRGVSAMLDSDSADFYRALTNALLQAVRRTETLP